MGIPIDELFFTIGVKAGPGGDKIIQKFALDLKKSEKAMGRTSKAAKSGSTLLDQYGRRYKDAAKATKKFTDSAASSKSGFNILDKAMKSIAEAADKFKSAATTIVSALKRLGTTAGTAATAVGRLRDTTKTSTTSTKQSVAAVTRATTAANRLNSATRQAAISVNKAGQVHRKSAAAVERSTVATKKNTTATYQAVRANKKNAESSKTRTTATTQSTTATTQSEAATREATEAVDDYDQTTKKSTKSTSGLAGTVRSLANMFGGLLVVRAITRAMTQFETRIAEIATISSGGAEQVEVFRKATLALSREVPQSAEELGAGVYQILSSNIKDTGDVLNILEASAKAAVAGLSDTFTAVDTITTVLNAFGYSADQATRVADVLFKTVEYGKIKFNQLASELGATVTTAALAGISIEEVGAAIAVLTQRGISAAESTTALNRFLLTLVKQTPAQRRAFKNMEIDFSIAAVKAKGFAAVLADLNNLTEGQIDVLGQLYPNIRAARAAFVLLGNGADMYVNVLEEMHNAQGASQRAFEIMNATAANQAKILRNNLAVIFQEISVSVLPGLSTAFAWIAEKLGDFVGGIKIMGAEATLVLQHIEIFGEKVSLFLARQIEEIFQFWSEITGRLEQKAYDMAVAIRPFSEGMSTAFLAMATGAGAISNVTGDIADNAEMMKKHWEDSVEDAEQFLVFLREAVEAEKELMLTETSFASLRAQYLRAQKEAGEQAEANMRLTSEEMEQQKTIAEELARLLRQVTLTSAQQQIHALADLRERYDEAFTGIGEEAERSFERIGHALEKALRIEKAQQLVDTLKQTIENALGNIEFDALNIEFEDEDERQAYILERRLAHYKQLRQDMLYMLEHAELTTEEYNAMRVELVAVAKLIRQAGKAQDTLGSKAERAANRMAKRMRQSIRLIRDAADAALELAENLGLGSDEVKNMASNLEKLAEGATTLAYGITTKNPMAMITGGLQTAQGVTGILGIGESEKERKQREALEHNTQSLRNLTRVIGEFGLDITGTEFSRVQRLLTEAISGGQLVGLSHEEALQKLVQLGYTLDDVHAFASKLNIEFADTIPTLEELQYLLYAVNQVELTQFANTFVGQMQSVQAEFDIFDISNPTEQLERLAEVMSDPSFGSPALRQALAGLDLSTSEGRRLAQENIERLFRLLQTGGLDPAQLGGLTVEEFLNALRQIESLLDVAGAGDTQDVRRTLQITELQANQLLAYQSTLVFRAEERNILLENMLAAMTGSETIGGISPISPPTIVPTGVGTTVVQIGPNTITLQGGGTTDQAEDFVDEIERILGERLEDRRQLVGI